MNEEEWFSAIAPGRMLWHVQKHIKGRKPNLFAVACLRRIWHLLPGPRSRRAVETLERYADENATADELAIAREDAREEGYGVDTGGKQHPSVHAAMAASYDDPEYIADFAAEATAWVKEGTPEAISSPEEKAQTELVREIFGNPFRPVNVDPSWLSWNDGTVFKLAQGIYDERAFDRLPVLADALEEAGCDNNDILNHCRQPGEHVRGCWVVDLILGKG